MNIVLSARNAMGVEADYSVEVESLLELQSSIRKLYALPGIVRVSMTDEAIKRLEEWSDQWEGFDNT